MVTAGHIFLLEIRTAPVAPPHGPICPFSALWTRQHLLHSQTQRSGTPIRPSQCGLQLYRKLGGSSWGPASLIDSISIHAFPSTPNPSQLFQALPSLLPSIMQDSVFLLVTESTLWPLAIPDPLSGPPSLPRPSFKFLDILTSTSLRQGCLLP